MFLKPPDQKSDRWEFGRFHGCVSKAPEVLGQFPIGCFTEEIDIPGDGRIRAADSGTLPTRSVPGLQAFARKLCNSSPPSGGRVPDAKIPVPPAEF